ncbi:transcriptional regulator, HxlR family [Lentzea xinjiangensis]|uniref:Transcriptional regulator, HxlR family n=1 Tax=Lentzea xinjiangensis TaxID=402600 RepID=A0A1H9PEU1_9PSEU|nr:helix-turn-helix domain-containing protein [Lentzea xinjiangensis]SER46349.1 transcriptional regulator, HxlR family [Lentzea xinjiangensis]
MNEALGEPTPPPDNEESCHRIPRSTDVLGVRWTGRILIAAARGARRFTEYRTLVPEISDIQLTLRLKQFQVRGLVERTVVPSTPVQSTYRLTADAEQLIRAIRPVSAWSGQHLAPEEA